MSPTPAPEPEHRLDAERLVQARLGAHPLDFPSMDAISNIYRAASAVRRRAERQLLSEYNLSWGGFTILWVLWVWGEMETANLAAECGLAKGTVSGMVGTLEKQGLVQRGSIASDKRRVVVTLTSAGEAVIAELFPRFNAYEGQMSTGLTTEQKQELARLLRIVITNAG